MRDESGDPVQPSEALRRFREIVRGEYKHALLEAIHAARRVGVREEDIAVASVFTTQSASPTCRLHSPRAAHPAERRRPRDGAAVPGRPGRTDAETRVTARTLFRLTRWTLGTSVILTIAAIVVYPGGTVAGLTVQASVQKAVAIVIVIALGCQSAAGDAAANEYAEAPSYTR